MATLLGTSSKDEKKSREEEAGGQMSFLEHLDELRSRIIRSIAFVFIIFIGCWFVSDYIYNFLAVPVQRALAEAQRRELPIGGLTGQETILPNSALKDNDTGRYVFENTTKLGASVIPPGASVTAKVHKDAQGNLRLYTDEALLAGSTVIPKGVLLPFDFQAKPRAL
ncbi:MAG TPA: twin-arginine translocase subunit TatC, partial [Pyrinomonadaceae bacterium]|nr:twin-arginine translocase subunit TatC [Pyrinomonadaceae bacterium]